MYYNMKKYMFFEHLCLSSFNQSNLPCKCAENRYLEHFPFLTMVRCMPDLLSGYYSNFHDCYTL